MNKFLGVQSQQSAEQMRRASMENNRAKGVTGDKAAAECQMEIKFRSWQFWRLHGSGDSWNHDVFRYVPQFIFDKKFHMTKFLDWLDAGYIKSVTIGSSKIDIELKGDELLTLTGQGSMTYYTGNPGDLFLVERLNKAGVTFKEKIDNGTTNLILDLVIYFIVPIVGIWILMGFVMKRMGGGSGGGIMGVGKSRAKVYIQKETGVTFKDVAGQDEAKLSHCRRS